MCVDWPHRLFRMKFLEVRLCCFVDIDLGRTYPMCKSRNYLIASTSFSYVLQLEGGGSILIPTCGELQILEVVGVRRTDCFEGLKKMKFEYYSSRRCLIKARDLVSVSGRTSSISSSNSRGRVSVSRSNGASVSGSSRFAEEKTGSG